MSDLITNIIKKCLQQIEEIDNEIKKQEHKPNSIFNNFDTEFLRDIENSKKAMKRIRNSIHCTKK